MEPETLKTVRFGRSPPAALMAATPRGAGISGKKKGPEIVRTIPYIANAPGGVGKLRELVLASMVQGRLVPQDAADEAAAEWLSRLAVTKSEWLRPEKIARPTAFVDTPIAAPCSIPTYWALLKSSRTSRMWNLL